MNSEYAQDRSVIEAREQRGVIMQEVLSVLLVIAILLVVWGVWVAVRASVINGIGIANARVVGESALCPGDKLILSYDFHANGAGKLIEDATIWKERPPKTAVYSESKDFLLDGTIDQHVTRAWIVPENYLDPATAEIAPLPAGEYRRLFSISSPSRSTVFAIGSVQFSIKERCPA